MDYSQIIAYWTTLCMTCAPNVHPATTAAIITTESGGNPYAIGDNTTHKSYSPRNKADALKIAESLLKQNHSIDIGLMQINSTHIKPMKLNLNSLFDSCYNISVGSRILTDFYIKHSQTSSNPQEALMKAISSYNTGNPFKGYYNGYVGKTLKSVNYAFLLAPTTKTNIKPLVALNTTNQELETANADTPLSIEESEKNKTNQDLPEEPNTSFFYKKRK